MTEETQGVSPAEDATVLPAESSTAPTEPDVPVDTPTDDAGPPRDDDGKYISQKLQQRIDKLTWEREQARREADFYRQTAQPKPEPKAPEVVKLPSLEEHGYDEAKYQAALIDYATKQAERVVEERLTQAERQREEQARLGTFAERQREFAKVTPDFEARVLQDPTLPISEAMRDVIVDSPTGPEIAYYLAQNRELAEQIARLPVHLAALEMGRIEGRLQASKAQPKPSVSKAPPPPPKVEEAEVSLTGFKASDAESDKLSDAEWMRLRNKEIKRRKA